MRGSGRTTRQMRDAPTGAIYIWCNQHFIYPKNLAREIGRSDLKIISPGQAETYIRGVRRPIVIDHAIPDYYPHALCWELLQEIRFRNGLNKLTDDIIVRLQKRAEIRRQAAGRKSVAEGKPDRLADLLDEAAAEIKRLRRPSGRQDVSRCTAKKTGEFNNLRCCREAGHDGEHNYVVDD